jgi:hypothetical protein
MVFRQSILNESFWSWLIQEKENRRLVWLAAICIIIQLIVFKFYYPFPNFLNLDSKDYLEAAISNPSIAMRPMGYPKFLRMVSSISNSSLFLVCCQYLLLELGILYFLFSVKFLLFPAKWTFRIILAISILNPLIPHISNFVSSDCLFIALSLVWVTQLFWILTRPTLRLFIWHALVLFLCFYTRFNGLWYPLISLPVFLIAHITLRPKLIGIGTLLVLLVTNMGVTEYAYFKETGRWQFSAFGGWQLASNALYGYAYSESDIPTQVPKQFRQLQTVVNAHMDSIRHIFIYFRPDYDIGGYYLWNTKSPLSVYLHNYWRRDTSNSILNHWESLAPFYSSYGLYLIRTHPGPYIRFFIWPNLINFYVPPVSSMGNYDFTSDSIVTKWFHWPSQKSHIRYRNAKISILNPLPTISAIVNFVFFVSFLIYGLLGGFSLTSFTSRRILVCTTFIWICNLCFSVLAAPVELRYQLFSLVLTSVFLGLFLSLLWEESKSRQKLIQVTNNPTL